jgi:hypothetical protein
VILLGLSANIHAQSNDELSLKVDVAEGLAELALHCIHTEFPNKTGHIYDVDENLKTPKEMHPAFYGCFDWHSSVHGHWMLVKVLKSYPNSKMAKDIRAAIDQNITEQSILAEVEYFKGKLQKNYERTYGWAWLFQLQSELHTWDDAQGKKWEANLKPLVDLLRERMIEYLPKLTYPIRTGVHPNTAFALGFAYDYAMTTGDDEFAKIVKKRSFEYYLADENYPAYLEPNGTDFFSPSLLEADLLSRLMNEKEFEQWFDKFMPKLTDNILQPAVVSDRNDLQIVHLDGLNLSRTWCMKRIASKLPESNKKRKALGKAALSHINDGLKSVASGDYAGEHWLASFAIYALSL